MTSFDSISICPIPPDINESLSVSKVLIGSLSSLGKLPLSLIDTLSNSTSKFSKRLFVAAALSKSSFQFSIEGIAGWKYTVDLFS